MSKGDTTAFLNIHVASWDGPIPDGHVLVVHERTGTPDDGYVLYGFDEIGLFDSAFTAAAYSFIKEPSA